MTPAELLSQAPVLPVIVVDDPDTAVPLAEALVAGGLPVLEVTLRTPAALGAITAMSRVAGAIVGAGTVTRPAQFEQVRLAGAEFVVTPGCTSTLLATAADTGIPVIPGVMTPSEALAALAAGFDHLKLFPAGPAGGIPLLKALAGPLPEARFCPTGGVGPDNLRDYLALPNVVCVGGSWVVPTDKVQAGDWTGITELARQAVKMAKGEG